MQRIPCIQSVYTLRDPAGERTYKQLRDEIILGRIRGGTRLVEAQLAAHYGVSRTPIREALRRLAQSGLVELIPRGGAVVKTVTAEDIRSAYICRGVLEGLAARLACEQRTIHDLLDLEEVQGAARGALASRVPDDVLAINQQFHDRLVFISRNAILADLWNHLTFYTAQYRETILQVSRRSLAARKKYLRYVSKIVEEHDDLIRLIKAQRADEAEEFVRRHFEHTAAFITDALQLPRAGVVATTPPASASRVRAQLRAR